jgi:hypothetical protein
MFYRNFFIYQHNQDFYYVSDRARNDGDSLYLNKLKTLLPHSNISRQSIQNSYHQNAFYQTTKEAMDMIDNYLLKPIVSRRK